MRRFKVYDNQYRKKLMEGLKSRFKTVDDNGELTFTWEEVYLVAKSSGLKSNKKRHILKRFRLVMNEAISALVEAELKVDSNTSI